MEKTLTETLADLGYKHQKAAGSASTGRHDVIAMGSAVVFTGRAHEVWEWVAALEPPATIRKHASECSSVGNFLAGAAGRLVVADTIVHLESGPVNVRDDRAAIRAAIAAGGDPYYELHGPSVGALATLTCGSDWYAYTVIDVSETGHTVTIQRRRERGDLNYENPNGPTVVVTRRKTLVGVLYREKGSRHGSVAFGAAWEKMDRSF